jgi:cytochrome c-type biogenesis protein CcmH
VNTPVKLTQARVSPAASSRATLVTLLAGAAVASAALAAVLGLPRVGSEPPADATPAPGTARLQAAVLQPEAAAMVDRLAARLATATDGTAADWTFLGRSAAALGRRDQAETAYLRAVNLAPDDAGLLTEAADVLLEARDARAAARAESLLERARQADPAHLPAWLSSGNAAFARGDVDSALKAWTQALRLAPPDSSVAAMLTRSLQSLHGTPAQAAQPHARLQGTVRVAGTLAAQVQPDDTLFVFARPAEGEGPPVAIVRLTARELPARFDLDLGAWPPKAPAQRWIVIARIARGGDALPQPGDLVGRSDPVAGDARGIDVTIAAVQR